MSVTLAGIVVDCADAATLAGFWSGVLGAPVRDDAIPEIALIPLDGAPLLTFVQVPEGKVVKNRLHLDLATADLAGEVERIVGLGAAELAEYDEHDYRWVTLADPEGNEFDVVFEAAPGVED